MVFEIKILLVNVFLRCQELVLVCTQKKNTNLDFPQESCICIWDIDDHPILIIVGRSKNAYFNFDCIIQNIELKFGSSKRNQTAADVSNT